MKTMIKYIISMMLLLSAIGLLSACNTNLNGKWLHGNGVLTTKTIEAPAYHSIEAHRAVEVELVADTVRQLTVTTDENILPYVVVTCQHGRLCLTVDDAIHTVGDLNIRVTLPLSADLREIRTTSAAEIRWHTPLVVAHEVVVDASSSGEIEGAIQAPKVTISNSSASELSLALTCDELVAHMNSASSAELRGKCRSARLLISSAAELEADELIAEEWEVNASSAASAELFCTRLLRADVSSAADVEYAGTCLVESQTSSGGSVYLNE